MQNEKSWGQIAYEGYLEKAAGRSLVTGDTLPGWPDLADEVQEAWQAAGTAVYQHVTAIPGG